MSTTPKQGQNIRALNGKLRIQYDPEWGHGKPYCTYYNGTAGDTFQYLHQAADHLTIKHYGRRISFRWTDWTDWT